MNFGSFLKQALSLCWLHPPVPRATGQGASTCLVPWLTARWGSALAPRAGSSAHPQPVGEDGTGSEPGCTHLHPRWRLLRSQPPGSGPSRATGQQTPLPWSHRLPCSALLASPAHRPLAQGLASACQGVPKGAGLLSGAARSTRDLHLPPAGLSCCSLTHSRLPPRLGYGYFR